MNYKSYILSTMVCFLSLPGFAQIEQDIIRPSINAEQFSIGAKAETALTKGQLSVNIPLMELKGKGYNLPISLAFYGGDVTYSTEASPIGLGWSLLAGGVVTKTIKGTDDTENNGANREHHFNDDFLNNSIHINNGYDMYRALESVRRDPMPDEYTYSIPGHNGTVDVTTDNGTITKKLYPDESYRIEELERGVCITADDGTKFYFEDIENHHSDEDTKSASWFLTRIVTIKGGVFTFNYAKEEYVDLSSGYDGFHAAKYRTNRITSIVSDYGTITFSSVRRSDRNGYNNVSIASGCDSERINKIELRDENGNFVKGFELDNSGWFTYTYAPEDLFWTDIRHKLSSVTQYDSVGNRLPPYKFCYSYQFSRSRVAGSITGSSQNIDSLPKDSWTSSIGSQSFANLDQAGNPSTPLMLPGTDTPDEYSGSLDPTVYDYFCLSSITYPTSAKDLFVYEDHTYGMINNTMAPSTRACIQGKRLASKTRRGNEVCQKTDYIYKLHDSDYRVTSSSSGVLTNPSFHCATYYTPGAVDPFSSYTASKITSERAFNSYMGTPVFYTEVEEVEKGTYGNVLSRTIHYYEPTIVNPPTNYIFVYSNSGSFSNSFVEITNKIFGEQHCNWGYPTYFNGMNKTYLAYPVGEFCVDTNIGEQPLKEVFIGEDGRVRSIKRFNYRNYGAFTKYGYKIDIEECPSSTGTYPGYYIFRFSKSEYNTRRYRPETTNTTLYFYNGEECDSICEGTAVRYSKGRVKLSGYGWNNDSIQVLNYFPDEISGIVSDSSSPEIDAISKLIEKNIIAAPIKSVNKRNGTIIGGECKDYQVQNDFPLTKSIYKIKNTYNNREFAPAVSGSTIDYRADIYKDGEILTYDENLNPEHVRSNEILDRIYVWGYDGRFPIAIIDNLDYNSFNTNTTLKSMLHGLEQYRRIETEQECTSLRNANSAIRLMLPETAHITTFTYDPYFGMTSEMNDSNYGTISTYDSFGRLSAKYDAYYKKLEEYNYNIYQQQ